MNTSQLPVPSAERANLSAALITRFILERGKMANGRVKWRAFEPDGNDNETSVFDVSTMENDAVWVLGDREVALPRGRDIIARAELSVLEASMPPLFVERDEPPVRHMCIRGFPPEKEATKPLLMHLAAVASLHVR